MDVPENYTCADCGKHGLKLWREYQSFKIYLRCCDCAAVDQKVSVLDIDADGMRSHEDYPGARTDQIGSYIPAVPSENTYWGYTSTPQVSVEWWKALPTRL